MYLNKNHKKKKKQTKNKKSDSTYKSHSLFIYSIFLYTYKCTYGFTYGLPTRIRVGLNFRSPFLSHGDLTDVMIIPLIILPTIIRLGCLTRMPSPSLFLSFPPFPSPYKSLLPISTP